MTTTKSSRYEQGGNGWVPAGFPIDIKTGYPTSSMSFPAVTSSTFSAAYVMPGQVIVSPPTPQGPHVRKCGYCGVEKEEGEVKCPMCGGRKTVYE